MHLPSTYEEAVSIILSELSETNRKLFLSTRKERGELVKIYHTGDRMFLFRCFGLYGRNPELIESCARKAGKETLHPSEATMMIIEGVWETLHSNVGEKLGGEESEPAESKHTDKCPNCGATIELPQKPNYKLGLKGAQVFDLFDFPCPKCGKTILGFHTSEE